MSIANQSVFYFFKQLHNSFSLECSVTMMPLHASHTCGYTFTLTSVRSLRKETAVIENLTAERDVAEKLFDRICTERLLPTELENFAKNFIANR